MGNRVVSEYIIARPGTTNTPWAYLCQNRQNGSEFWGNDMAKAVRYTSRAAAVRRADRMPQLRGISATVVSVPRPNGPGAA